MKVSISTYKQDKYYPRIVAATEKILTKKRNGASYVTPIEILIEMGVLDDQQMQRWRQGKVPYLEKVIQCNLSKANRILRILRFHVHDLRLQPSIAHYKRKGQWLRFSKSGEPIIEEAYARHFVKLGKNVAD